MKAMNENSVSREPVNRGTFSDDTMSKEFRKRASIKMFTNIYVLFCFGIIACIVVIVPLLTISPKSLDTLRNQIVLSSFRVCRSLNFIKRNNYDSFEDDDHQMKNEARSPSSNVDMEEKSRREAVLTKRQRDAYLGQAKVPRKKDMLNKNEMNSVVQDKNPLQFSTHLVTKFKAVHGDENNYGNVLNVHVVPHTHDDVGWRKTVEQYYYPNSNTTLDIRGSVRDIIRTVIESLLDNPARTFTYVEQKFFSMYYKEILQMDNRNELLQAIQGLINTGQLIFVNGGWCMHDEATTHFMGMIDQTSLGHLFLYNSFDGYVPTVGWQLDPFGHSNTQASLLSSMAGFNALYFGRIDHEDKELRKQQQQCEGLWNGSYSLSNTEIFWGLTGSYDGNYGPPAFFCFDLMCENDGGYLPLIHIHDEKQFMDRILLFLREIQVQSEQTQGHHIMLTMGSDFHYQNAYFDYSNMDLLIQKVMEYQELKIINITSIFEHNIPCSMKKYDTVNIFYSNPEYYTYNKYIETIQARNIEEKKGSAHTVSKTKSCHDSDCMINMDKKNDNSSGKNNTVDPNTIRSQSTIASAAVSNDKRLLGRSDVDVGSNEEVNKTTCRIVGVDDVTDGVSWITKKDDFFPYADCDHCYWTGFFTSRTALKRFERVTSSFLLAARQIDAMAIGFDSSGSFRPVEDYRSNLKAGEAEPLGNITKVQDKDICATLETASYFCTPLFPLEDALGIAQHHDAVAGTAKQHVADDYSKKLQTGIDKVVPYVTKILKRVMNATAENMNDDALENLAYCQLLNETLCHVSEDATARNDTDLYVLVYNALAQNRSSMIRLPVSANVSYKVERLDGRASSASYQAESTSIICPIASIPLKGTGPVKSVLVFNTGSIPPIGAAAFRISKAENVSKTECNDDRLEAIRIRHTSEDIMEVSTGLLSVKFDKKSGVINGIASGDVDLNVTQVWGYYPSYSSRDASFSNVNSGAYIFRPNIPSQPLIPLKPKLNDAKFVKTSVGMEIHASFEVNWIKQVTYLIENQPYVEIEYTVGPIPIDDGVGKEIVTRFTTPISNQGIFYTDSNGREFMRRKLDSRPSWNLTVFEPVSGNYYPVNAAIYIEDSDAAFTVLVDRSEGGSALLDGTVELMVQRRTLADDSRGVDEAMNETVGGVTPYPPYGNATRVGEGVIIRGRHRILVGTSKVGGASLARSEMDSAFAEPLVFVGSSSKSNPINFQNPSFSGIQQCLPANVMLITFARLHYKQDNTFLLRLGHQYGINDSAETLSLPVTIDLAQLFSYFFLTSVVEKTIGGAENWVDYLKRKMDWTQSLSSLPSYASPTVQVTLLPMQIRTFEVTMLAKSNV